MYTLLPLVLKNIVIGCVVKSLKLNNEHRSEVTCAKVREGMGEQKETVENWIWESGRE